MTAITRKPENPIAHLSDADIEEIGARLDAIRQEVVDTRGADDAAYIRKVIDVQRKLELGSRAVLLASVFPPAWVLGTLGLSVAKILDNMEIGHNIMHGQWDWMRDPKIHSSTWEWDNVTPSEVETTTASTVSPTATVSSPSSSCSSARSIVASPLPPTSTKTTSRPIKTTTPWTICPVLNTAGSSDAANSAAKSSSSTCGGASSSGDISRVLKQ